MDVGTLLVDVDGIWHESYMQFDREELTDTAFGPLDGTNATVLYHKATPNLPPIYRVKPIHQRRKKDKERWAGASGVMHDLCMDGYRY